MYCAPAILWFEMNRGVGEDVAYRTESENVWMDWAVVDARPFLLYLQYLTFDDLRERQRQLQGLQELKDMCTNVESSRNLFHTETACNLLGHCLEMEGEQLGALAIYTASRDAMPRNNAANLHSHRLTGTQ